MKNLLNHLVVKSIGYSLFLLSASVFAQTGPGGVGATDGTTTLRAWWRSDTGITLTGGAISNWADLSGYNNHLSQSTAESRPSTAISTALNNRTVVRYAGSHFFTSSFSGPGVDNFTLFLVTNGTAYQSLMRFQNIASTYVVYPYGATPNTFVMSNDGGSARGISAGLVNSVNNIGAVRYRRNVTTRGMQSFRNGGFVAQRTSANVTLPSQPFFSGALALSPGFDYSIADVGEMVVFYSALNDAQMVIVQNYLAAKFNISLTANDVYTMDDTANGDYDSDVAGIGRVNASNLHADAQGTGLVRILNPQGLNNNEFFMWGHNNQPTAASEKKDIPSGLDGRMARVWRVSEVNSAGTAVDVGALDVRFDLTGLGAVNENHLRLLVDTDDDGVFSDETPISGASSLGNSIYQFAAVTRMTNATRFTLATASHATPLNGIRTFYSLATGDWESNNSWSRTSDGSSGALNNGELPLRTDNVVIRTGHTITINNVSDNGSAGVKPDDLGQTNIGPFTGSGEMMFYQTGDIFIDGTLNIVDIEIMVGGYTEILSAGSLTAGSSLVNTGYMEAASGSVLTTLDDFILTGNSISTINTNSVSNDDLIIDNADAVLCGTGSTILQNGGGSKITYKNGALIDQVCITFTVTCSGSDGGGCARSFPLFGTKVTIAGGNGPAGIGITNGTSNLVLWLDATRIDAANNATVTTWNDLSRYGHNFSEGNGATYKTNAVNGHGTLEFNGTSNYFQRAFTSALNPASYSIFTANNVTSSATNKAIISSQTDGPSKGYILNNSGTAIYPWSFWTGNGNDADQLPNTTSTAGTWASQSAWYNTSTKFFSVNNGTVATQNVSSAMNTDQNTRIGAGQQGGNPAFYFDGRMSEVIMYGAATNVAQVVILNNYLAAKYNFSLAANDVYAMDNDLGTARDDYDHQVAGIGQATDGSYQRDARGTGMVRVWNPQALSNGEFLMWGHNNNALSTTNAASAVDGILIRERLIREWAVSETGDAGAVNISFDLTEFSGFLGSNLYLLIDRDGDGYKDNDVAPQAGSYSGKKVTFSRVNLQNGDRFTLGNSSVDQPLPVTLVSFTATPQPSSVVLSWKTASEVNNNYFDVQRSLSAEAWETLTRVPGAGNSTQEKVYLYRDEAPLQGKSYYRLKQTDYDGKFTYSRLVLVEYTYALALQPFPNPSTGVFTLKDENLTQEQIELVNMFGHKVPFRFSSNTDTQIDISDQPAGVYVIRVFSRNVLQSIRVVKQ